MAFWRGVRYGANDAAHMHRQGLRKRAFSLESAATTATGMVAAPELVGVKGGRGGEVSGKGVIPSRRADLTKARGDVFPVFSPRSPGIILCFSGDAIMPMDPFTKGIEHYHDTRVPVIKMDKSFSSID